MSKSIVFGIPEVREVLEQITPVHSRRLISATLRGVATEIKNKAKTKAPRDSGTLKKSIYVYKPRTHKDKPQFQVKFRQRKGATNNAFYWRFVEFGTGGGRNSHIPLLTGERDAPLYAGAQPFLQPSVHEVQAQLPSIIKQQFSAKLERAIERELKKARART